jgi:hypothetical protein
MRRQMRLYSALGLSAVLVMGFTAPCWAQSRVRAKIGIRIASNNRADWAKTRDRLQAGDLLRVYVLPEEDAYIYLVYTDKKTPVLLNSKTYKEKIAKSTIVAFPSESDFYQTDGANPLEYFTIVCSPTEIPDIANLFNSPHVSHAQWIPLEAELVKRSTIDIDQKSEKPFAIAGSVRGGTASTTSPSFIDELLIFSGESLVVKRYEFAVKK